MDVTPADFKSAASANSATPAHKISVEGRGDGVKPNISFHSGGSRNPVPGGFEYNLFEFRGKLC